MATETPKKPWYKEPFVWMIIGLPALSIVMSLIGIRLAVVSDDGLVVDDYYKRGLEINQTLERDKAAATHGLSATLQFNHTTQSLILFLKAKPDYSLPTHIDLLLSYHTRVGLDKTVTLQRLADNAYQAPLPELTRGWWRVQLTADDWRLTDSFWVPLQGELNITPAVALKEKP